MIDGPFLDRLVVSAGGLWNSACHDVFWLFNLLASWRIRVRAWLSTLGAKLCVFLGKKDLVRAVACGLCGSGYPLPED